MADAPVHLGQIITLIGALRSGKPSIVVVIQGSFDGPRILTGIRCR